MVPVFLYAFDDHVTKRRNFGVEYQRIQTRRYDPVIIRRILRDYFRT